MSHEDVMSEVKDFMGSIPSSEWAVRDGDLKYVRKTEDRETQEWLFDLSADISEQQDLLHTRSSEAKRLKESLAIWEADVESAR